MPVEYSSKSFLIAGPVSGSMITTPLLFSLAFLYPRGAQPGHQPSSHFCINPFLVFLLKSLE
ncbi:hypothetical protein A2W70_00590 [Candidatus Curtissbacteria bacterium RIFCSPLOWO2_02_41_11]|uniref:Uncharacterized protein n=1 Tax=Candidatus Curtissbacteria bacterium RIFCSPLOWO2_02_41_11 TaxID=1797731 RepID=A0A1F5HTQ7_9BACT|nr:MAG: hypothetical protein A2W70_00590 [Candidatus Curtissbacteria bacterium RIFCSPLOWO2_02_41_11]